VTLIERIRTADPLAGELPPPLTPPRLAEEAQIVEFFDTAARRSGAPAWGASAPVARRRPSRGGLVGGLTACVLAVIVVVLVSGGRGGLGESPALARFSVSASSGAPASIAQLDGSVRVLRQRLATVGGGDWTVAGSAQLVSISCPGCGRAAAATAVAVAQPGELRVYDWEANVLGPGCRPRPGSVAVTGGPAAGQAGAASTSSYAAVLRASRCPAATGAPAFYAVDDAAHRVLAGPEASAAVARDRAGRAGNQVATVRVPAGATVVQTVSGDGWFVLRDKPALDGQQVATARQGADPTSGAPDVAITFTSRGQAAFRALTRRETARVPAASGPEAFPHFAIVLDHRLLSVPYVDARTNAGGIDGRQGIVISGGFTPAGARTLVALLRSGVLPARLAPLSG
jgi:SecD/SecF fusion protein